MSGSGFPATEAPDATAWRALLTLAVVFVLLATTGWTAVKGHEATPGPRAAALMAWDKGTVAGRQLPDAEGASPRKVSGFFGSLTERQRERLADRYPLVVGNLNGAPAELRYRANHAALVDARDTERKRMHSSELTEEGRHMAGRRMHRFESMVAGDRQILAFDPTGYGRAAEVFGDLDRADRVSVIVPGVDTELLTFEKTERRHTAPVGMAKALQRKQHAAAPSVRTATVAWADYTAPRGLGVDAASVTLAQDGADRLVDFVRGGLPGGSQVSLFCHSYGSVTCGVAADELPSRVSDIAVSGSPGMRADSVAELHSKARVWAMRDGDDWIADVPHMEFGGLGHGADPLSPGFGARRLSADGASGHAGYFAPGTSSLANQAAVGTGQTYTIDCADGAENCAAGTD
ncbi:hypothetical protein DVA86_18115 [Streptomyces armeniacus]|uniref:DUF1023 domain-containing protein n=1 Tax=Streptomyces armeniacus TaxID=83291 RepID=A0A345Y0L8_9ACTN|nr:alpha/beta hydrolase [Streptomyces armeniacus]AXK37434.1 hypothetical protein DVA86_18115 [Streptomyces armeniacus]